MDSNEAEGVCYPQPVTLEDRVAIARDFVRRHSYDVPLAIDPLENPADALYAGWPERFYVVDESGTIAFKGETGPFGFHPEEVAAWLQRRFPPVVLAPSEIASARIATEPLELRAVEHAESVERWRMTIDPSGLATVGRGAQAASRTLDRSLMEALRRTIADERPFAWREASGEPAAGCRVRVLAIRVGADSKILHRYSAVGEPPANEDGFERVWSSLQAIAPTRR